MLAIVPALACRYGPDQLDGSVVVLVMDGVRLEESLGDDPSSATGEHPQEFMPRTWSELLPQGARASEAWVVGATTTTPAHAALVVGRREPLANYPTTDDVGLYRPQLPTLLEEVHRQLDGGAGEASIVANSGLVQPVAHSLWPGLGEDHAASWRWVGQADDAELPSQHDDLVIEALKQRLQEVPTRLALVNLHQVDRSGHYGGAESYLDDVRDLDDPVVELWGWMQARQQREYRDDSWLLVLADHGRHSRSDDDPIWRNHGCVCNGCRRVPALLLGPGVAGGQDLAEPMLLTDVAPTVAALLGVELPWASGLPLGGLMDSDLDAVTRTGVADFAVAGGVIAQVDYLADPAHRSELSVGGQRLSDPDALLVEAPAMVASEDKTWLCFRELLLTPAEQDTAWQPRCFASLDQGSSWEELPAPLDSVGPHWRASLAVGPAGELLAAWPHNVNAVATNGAEGGEGEVSVDAARYADGAWTVTPDDGAQTWPQDASLALDGQQLLLAVGAAPNSSHSRHERDVHVGRVQLDGGDLAWVGVASADLRDLASGSSQWRLELPSLRLDDSGDLWLAAVGSTDSQSVAVMARSEDQGESWSDSAALELGHAVAPHAAPAWLGELAVWPVLEPDSDQGWLCAASLDREAACVETSPRVLRLAADGESIHALVDVDLGSWELHSWSSGEFQ